MRVIAAVAGVCVGAVVLAACGSGQTQSRSGSTIVDAATFGPAVTADLVIDGEEIMNVATSLAAGHTTPRPCRPALQPARERAQRRQERREIDLEEVSRRAGGHLCATRNRCVPRSRSRWTTRIHTASRSRSKSRRSRPMTSSTNHGELFVNPGGPADPGLDTPSVFAAELPTSVREKYDLIGFDPRGVEYSTPQTCNLKDPSLFDYFPYPAANGSIAANVRLAKAVATQCEKNQELKFFTTRNTARDMDRIRLALGVSKISYWGQSYGTYLGTVYANMFAERVDRMILEGNVGPTSHVWQDESGLWDQGMADRFPDAAKVAAADNNSIGFGSTVAEVTARTWPLPRSSTTPRYPWARAPN